MGIVSDHLRDLIARQVQESGLVVWFDPDDTYAAFIASIALPDTTIARYDGSFFALRHAIDPLLAGEEPPRLVVYVPKDEEQTAYALVELTSATKAVLKPGQNPITRNTRLSVVARHALRPRLGDEMAEEIARKADAGTLTLADLDSIAERGGALASGVLPVIFGSGTGTEMALSFLTDARYDEAIIEKRATRSRRRSRRSPSPPASKERRASPSPAHGGCAATSPRDTRNGQIASSSVSVSRTIPSRLP